MSEFMYDASVPQYLRILGAFHAILGKAEAHCASGAANDADLFGCRLAEDMLPLSFQVLSSITHSAGAIAALKGETYVKPETLETFTAAKAAIGDAIAYLEAVKPADLAGTADEEVLFKTPRGDLPFIGVDFLTAFSLPNFYFHTTTAYAILRHRGLEIGKRDFLGGIKASGELRPKAA
jgi:hypothetical protein